VQVACTVAAPDGTQVRGLTQDISVCSRWHGQEIASFDASATPASIALVLDVSPSIFRELAEMRGAAHSLAANLSPPTKSPSWLFHPRRICSCVFDRSRAARSRHPVEKFGRSGKFFGIEYL